MTRARRRLDTELVSRGLFAETQQAREAIKAKRILVDGAPAQAPSSLIGRESTLKVLKERGFASRGGEKLEGALRDLHVDVAGKRCLDAGAGSGGFTDCLLQHGAAFVLAVDVGYGQFDWRLRNDPRVRLLERTHIRSLTPEIAQGLFDLVMADLSFIGLTQVASVLVNLTADGGSLLLMVKPQHEAKRADVGRRGIVRDPQVWSGAVESVASRLEELGVGVVAAAPSRLKGAQGNQEFFLLGTRGAKTQPAAWLRAVSDASPGRGK